MSTADRQEFQAEVQQLLDLVVHSLYSDKDVFLRELISNAADALDKRRFESLQDESLQAEELAIHLRVDGDARTLVIEDSGVGMSRDELVSDLGTIARSGTRAFLDALAEKKSSTAPDLIGQFGVGFYSSFMVAEEVQVLTRRVGEDTAHLWVSDGRNGYTIETAERDDAGTTITLRLKEADTDNGLQDYSDPQVLRGIVRRWSDFVTHPILLEKPPAETKADDESAETESEEQDVPTETTERLNSGKAPWTRPADEITEEEHAEFYKHVSHDWADPLLPVPVKIEGQVEARALLYIPSKAPMDLFWREGARRGVQLHVRRIFIMDDCEELLPDWLRFVRGVVDAEDLSLNVSREILQKDRQVRAISKFLVKKVLSALEQLQKDDREKYLGFWREFGNVLKEGLLVPGEHQQRLLGLCLFESTASEDGLTTLAEYHERKKDDQDAIYHATGSSREALLRSPHLEAFLDRELEVLLLIDSVDELWAPTAPEHEGLPWKSVGKGEVELGSDEEKAEKKKEREEKTEELGDLLGFLKGKLDGKVKDVSLSARLSSSPACLVAGEHDPTPAMEEMMRRMGQEGPKVQRTLELNADHPLVATLQSLHAESPDDELLAQAAEVLHGQALLAEGGAPEDPAAFSKLLTELMQRALGAGSK
ncbi:MAG: molecular chaperone HtpG [Acidobacteriota bacterium]